MNCYSCARRTLSSLGRPLVDARTPLGARQVHRYNNPFESFADNRPSQRPRDPPARSPRAVATTTFDESTAEWTKGRSNRPAWQLEKEAIKKKLDGEAWNPRKKLSPDTMEGIRHLNQTQPLKQTTRESPKCETPLSPKRMSQQPARPKRHPQI